MSPKKYLRYFGLPKLFPTRRTKEILRVNPTVIPHREEAKEVSVMVYDYNADHLEEKKSGNGGAVLRVSRKRPHYLDQY